MYKQEGNSKCFTDSYFSVFNQTMLCFNQTGDEYCRKHVKSRRNQLLALSHYTTILFSSFLLFTTQSRLLTTVRKKPFENVGKGEKCWYPAFSPFPTMFSTLPKPNFNCYNIYFVICKLLSFGMV